MSKKDNLKGIASISIGVPGDGVVGGSLTAFTAIVLSSLNLTGTKVNTETLPIENIDNYLTVKSGSTPATATFKLLEVTAENAVMLMGGTWDAPSMRWEAPISPEGKRLSVVFQTEPLNGRYAKITFPNGFVVASYEGSISKNQLLSVNIDVTADIPETAAGVQNAPYSVQWFDV